MAAGCLLAAPSAEARFGKAGSRAHGASAVGKTRSEGKPPRRGPQRPTLAPSTAIWVSAGVSTVAYRPYSPPSERFFEDPPEAQKQVRLGVEAQGVKQGGALGLHFALEEERWGVSTRWTSLSLRAEDGLGGRDTLHLGGANVTFAAAVSHKGRLRFEGGVAVARAPGATFLGPSLAMTFERCLLGELDLEGGVQWVPVPHLQLDAQLGLALHLGPLALRAGWRGLLLNDRGLVDKVVHRDVLAGPFAGLGLHF
ncbi:hypothetical protein [Melittangium boletus]|nr:hypothetical protein [Melittangium boletus]